MLFIYYKRLNIKDIIYYSVEKEQETEKTQAEDQTGLTFKEERSSGAWCGKPQSFCWKKRGFAIKRSLGVLFSSKETIVDRIVEKSWKKELIENVNIKVFTGPIYPGVKPVTFLFI